MPEAASPSRTTSYPAAYFAPFAPRTAYDIAVRVPGFQLDLGITLDANGNNADVRGFAGTAGNVVINGARPSSKSETLETLLSRIPAGQVQRVEVGPGDLFGSDYAGKTQVLNLILSDAAGIDGNISASLHHHYDGFFDPDGTVSAMIRRGASTINLSAGTGRNRQTEEGTDIQTDAISGVPIEFRRKTNAYTNRDPYLSASWALERGSDQAIRLNARWQPSSFDLLQRNRVTPSDGAPHDDNLIQHYRDPLIEIGGDVTRPLAGGAIKLVGLATRRKRDNIDTYLGRDGLIADGALVTSGFTQHSRSHRNETLGRVSWTRGNVFGFSFEAGAEAAYNTLVSNVDLFENDNGQLIPVDLPIADATVKEKRAEGYVSLGRNLSKGVRIDGGVNFEMSHLDVSGDATATRDLKFLKPNISLDWKAGSGWHSRFSVRRTVAQLDFYDFISGADLSAGRINGGNQNLQPQRAWEFRATADHSLLGQGTVKLDLGYDLISLLQDRVLIFDDQGQAFDAPGNLGTGRMMFATLTVDAPLDTLWKGLRARFDGTARRTRVEDPISHQLRNFSGYFPDWEWKVDVRRDSGPWSYGATFNDNKRITFFRTDEFDSQFNGSALATAFAEFRPGPRTSVRLDLSHTFGKRHRLIFSPNRAQPDLVLEENRERDQHLVVGLTIKQSFGVGGVAK